MWFRRVRGVMSVLAGHSVASIVMMAFRNPTSNFLGASGAAGGMVLRSAASAFVELTVLCRVYRGAPGGNA